MLAMTISSGEEKLYRLPQTHVAVLQYVATGQTESDAGVRCRDFEDFTLSASAPDIDVDGYVHHLHVLERWCDRAEVWAGLDPTRPKWARRVGRCRRALARMRERGVGRSADVLMVAHGYPDAIVRQIPELAQMREAPIASLVRYTDVVERHRQAMVDREVGVEMRWHMTRAALRPEQGPATPPGWRVVAFSRPAAGAGPVVDIAAYSGRLRAAAARRRHLDLVVSSADALRDALSPADESMPVQAPGEPAHEYHARVAERGERRRRSREARAAFVTQARIEAMRMLSAAEADYYTAWSAVGWR